MTDVARALAALATGSGFEVLNVGTGVGTSIGDVLASIESILGRPVDIRKDPKRERADDGHLVSDPSRLMAATGWKPEHDLKSGLSELLASEGLL